MTPYDRLQKELSKQGILLEELANHLKIKPSAIQQWNYRSKKPPVKYINPICDYLNISAEYLLNGNNNILHSKNSKSEQELLDLYNSLTRKQKTIIKGRLYEFDEINKNNIKTEQQLLSSEQEEFSDELTVCIPDEENKQYKVLRLYDQRVSADFGSYTDDNVPYTEEKHELNYITKQADHIVTISGDSMSPTLANGDKAFVKEQVTLNNNDIGIFIYNDEVYCKRYHNDNTTITLISDNKDYDDIIISKSDKLKIIGKVIF